MATKRKIIAIGDKLLNLGAAECFHNGNQGRTKKESKIPEKKSRSLQSGVREKRSDDDLPHPSAVGYFCLVPFKI